MPADTDPQLVDLMQREAAAFARLREHSEEATFVPAVFTKLFCHDIEALLKLADLWTTRPPPTPLTWTRSPSSTITTLEDQEIGSLEQWLDLFESACLRLKRRQGPLYWDKEDEDCLDLVASAANLRAQAFDLPLTSRFQIKSMAGNIIPAIATTNAIAAGMIVLQARNLLRGRSDLCCTV